VIIVPKIDIRGVIVSNDEKWIYDWYEMDSICPKDVQDIIDSANGEKIETTINSPGGDIFAGADIYSALMRYNGEVEQTITSLAGSAASEVAMAGKCYAMPSALIMVHNVAVYGASGDYHDMDRMSEMLKKANQSIANTYMTKSGMNHEEVLEMMDKTTWMTAQEAKEKGLIDGILFMDDDNTIFTNGIDCMLTKAQIEHAKNEKKKQQTEIQLQEQLRNQLLEDLDLI
jgi:ATP-dependent Clp endopeptidase proteolytic subunit ClpP